MLFSCFRAAHADVGLIVETPTGLLGFLSDVGHVSVWISNGCLSPTGEVYFCQNSQGIVLSSTAYWPNPGAAAIPAEMFFLGARPGKAGRSKVAWNESLAKAYPNVDPGLGSKYLGRTWRRGMRVLTFQTTPEKDHQVLDQIEQQRRAYHYSYSHRNCAYYAEQVLRLYLGNGFHAGTVLDFGVETPRGLERTLRHHLEMDPGSEFRTVRFPGSMLHAWRQPPRNICESAIFDPKYAVPLVIYQPYLYVGFGVCYGVGRFMEHVPHARAAGMEARISAESEAMVHDPRVAAFESLTGPLPEESPWKTRKNDIFLNGLNVPDGLNVPGGRAGVQSLPAAEQPLAEPLGQQQ